MKATTSDRRLRRVLPVVLAAVVLAVSACGGGSDGAAERAPDSSAPEHVSDTTAEPASVDPCSLVTKAEAEAVLGPVAPPVESGAVVILGARACSFSLGDGTPVANVAIVASRTPDQFEQFTADIENNLGGKLETVEGLGDDARWYDSRSILIVLVADRILTVQLVLPGGEPEARGRALGLAELAVGRL